MSSEAADTADPVNAFLSRESLEPVDDGPLSGYSVAVKDNISTAGIRTSCGSRMLEEYVPPYSATVVRRLLEAGARIDGKTNMDEFGMGSTTETSAFGPTLNPVSNDHVPGGSSGGSAAAVAAGLADVALGSDTGGSIRCPAAFCGVVGLKPTYGLVSRYGLVAYANSLEQIGPIATSVDDLGEVFDVIAGPDERDATTRAGPTSATAADIGGATDGSYAAAVGDGVDGLTVGMATELLEGADEGVIERVKSSLDRLEAAGATVTTTSLPSLEYAVAAYYVLAMSEASSNLARYDGVRYGISGGFEGDWNTAFSRARERGFGAEVKRRILLGTFALSEGYQDRYYRQAEAARELIRREFDDAFQSVDLIASPTMPTTPFELGEGLEDPLQLYLADANTVPVNLADLPAISIPAGRSNGLPVGLQLIGPAFSERRLLRAAGAVT